MDYTRFIIKIADCHLADFVERGCAFEGNNGPYMDQDTALRNTAHWTVTYCYLYRNTNDEKYLKAINAFGEYFMDDSNYGMCGLPICRRNNRYDSTNGLIGIAWVIEGLIALYQITANTCYLDRAKEMFISCPYEAKSHVWKVRDINGEVKGIDGVYNHQLWFAAAGSEILDVAYDGNIDAEIRDFLAHSEKLFQVHSSGLAYHRAYYEGDFKGKLKFHARKKLGEFGNRYRIHGIKYASQYLEKGYHTFDLFGFALLHKRYGSLKIFQCDALKKALAYSKSVEYIEELKKTDAFDARNVESVSDFNKYAYGYNSPAFEYGFVQKSLCGYVEEEVLNEMMNFQIKTTFDEDSMLFSKNVYDPQTLTARIYELTRYLDLCKEEK